MNCWTNVTRFKGKWKAERTYIIRQVQPKLCCEHGNARVLLGVQTESADNLHCLHIRDVRERVVLDEVVVQVLGERLLVQDRRHSTGVVADL